MSEDDGGDKPYEPTSSKLDQLRRDGQVVKAPDLNTAAVYIGFYAAMAFAANWTFNHVFQLGAAILNSAPFLSLQLLGGDGRASRDILVHSFLSVTPIVLLPASVVLTAIIVQKAFAPSIKNIQPKANRISPLSNFKQKFGASAWIDFVKNIAKLILYSVALVLVLYSWRQEIFFSGFMTPLDVLRLLSKIFLQMTLAVCGISVVLGLLDWGLKTSDFRKKHMMSRKDIMDELKQNEGDPDFKNRRRERGREIALSDMLKEVPEASVIITNPTHFAVALKWDRTEARAPSCCAKGCDLVALKIREVSGENDIPIYENPPLARALYAEMELGEEIRVEHYAAVAAAIKFADKLRKKRAW